MLLLSDLSIHDVNNSILVSNKLLHLLNLFDLESNHLGQLVKSGDELLLVSHESFDVGVVSIDVLLQVCDFVGEELDVLVEVSLLHSDHVEELELLEDDSLSLFKGSVQLVNLLLDLVDLMSGIPDHLLAVLNGLVETGSEFLLLTLLIVFKE